MMRRFYLLALAKISQIERDFKSKLIQNMLMFSKFSEGVLSKYGNLLKAALIEAAV